jgi:hypothetical protein
MRSELAKIARLVDGMRKITHPMPLDIQVERQPSASARFAAKSYKDLPPAPVVRQ